MIVERVRRFIAGETEETFGELALEAFRYQFERVAAYRRLCDGRGVEPGGISGWREIPPVPALAFKSLELAAAPAQETFRSSGTAGVRSVHHHPFPDLYRAVIEATFPTACLPAPGRLPTLSLIPSRRLAPDSSLAFMADHILTGWGAEGSLVALGDRGVDLPRARSWLGSRQRDGLPCLVLSTSLALDRLLEGLERQGLRFRLAPGSVVFDTGGSKGRKGEIPRQALLERLEVHLAVPPHQVVGEYGMTELTTHFYTGALAGGDPKLFRAPPWARVRILDPQDLSEVAGGERGLICVLDLANLGSAIHLLTEDLGIAEEEGFRLAGRAAGAELRGCSLVVEELEAG